MALGHCRHRIHSLGWSIVMFFLIYWACIDEPWVSLVTRVQSAIKKRSNLLKNVSFTQAGCISEQQRTTSINNEYTSSLADGQHTHCPCPPSPLLGSSFRSHQHSPTGRSDRTSQERAQTSSFEGLRLAPHLGLNWKTPIGRGRPVAATASAPGLYYKRPQTPGRDLETEERNDDSSRIWLGGHTSEHFGALRCYILSAQHLVAR